MNITMMHWQRRVSVIFQGAIESLKTSLKFNKLNIDARNLLGLIYFEMGEVVGGIDRVGHQ